MRDNLHNINISDNNNYKKIRNKGLFPDKNTKIIDPRKESFINFLRDLCCPKFKLNSFCFIFILNNILFFILTLLYSGLDTKKDSSFLSPKSSTLISFGALSGKKLKENIPLNLYRWIMNAFLHGNFLHLFYNIMGIFTFGTYTEYLISSKYFCIIYLSSGYIGSLFSVLIEPYSTSVGASICVYGIFGAYFGNCIVKWKELDRKFGPIGKIFMSYVLFFFVIVSLLIQLPICNGDLDINIWGHFGGLISGIFSSITIVQPKFDRDSFIFSYKIWYIFSVSILGSFVIIGTLFFYLF